MFNNSLRTYSWHLFLAFLFAWALHSVPTCADDSISLLDSPVVAATSSETWPGSSVATKPGDDETCSPNGADCRSRQTAEVGTDNSSVSTGSSSVQVPGVSESTSLWIGGLGMTKNGHRIVPYGTLWGSAHYDTSRTYPGAYTLFVESRDREGEPAFDIDTRRTRLGVDIESPELNVFGGSRFSGRVEIDFHGSFVVENKPGVLLRHAFGKLSGEGWNLLAGQTSDVISPLVPHSLNYSVGWGAGNIGYRRMQVRWEQEFAIAEQVQALLQLAIAQNIVSDFRAAKGVEPESTSWPIVEGRVELSRPSPFVADQQLVIGLSGHVGQQGFDFTETGPAPLYLAPEDDHRVLTYSFNLDAEVPISPQAGVRGEFFFGQDLSTFLGGIVQGVNPITRRPIRARGGWIELYYHWTPRWHSYCGWSADDPDARFPGGRTLNQFLFVNTTHDLTEHLNLGLEVRWWSTHYFDQSSGKAVQFEFAGQYKF